MIKARLYQPSKTAMQSGLKRTKVWILEFIPEKALYREPLMGWIGMRDTHSQIKLSFSTQHEAENYAALHQIEYQVLKPQKKSFKVKRYSDNFSQSRS